MGHSIGWQPPGPGSSPNRVSTIVLVVDDYADLRRAVATLLKCKGYEVVEACNGHEALAQLRHHSPDLVVLDLEMPVMDGWQFRAAQRCLADERLAAIPVLLFTAADPAVGLVAALKAVGLVRKPFDPDVLLGAVELALAD
jgi:CheY-like chemotaxis protein